MSGLPLDYEQISPEEERFNQLLIDELKANLKEQYEPNMMRRDAHPKAHGCVRATFEVKADIPEDLKVGVFAEPREYPCWIRFSNAGRVGEVLPDKRKDLRGMAIKLVGVAGEKLLPAEKNALTQDFLAVTHPVFIVKNGIEFAKLSKVLRTGSLLRLLWFYIFRPRDFIILLRSQKQHGNVLGLRYWSMVPYRCGPLQVVKYSVIPRTDVDTRMPSEPSDNYLRERLRNHLQSKEAVFDFALQKRTDPENMPIEDARVRWSEETSPFITVATIRIPPQSFESADQEAFCENLSFTPWHSLPEHAPLGGVNRARRIVYDAISAFRHEKNGSAREEPTTAQQFD